MKALLLRCVWTSVEAGVGVLAVLLVCSLLRRLRAPSRYLCWLWLAAGARFLLPGIPLTLPRPHSAPLAKAADTVQAFAAGVRQAAEVPAVSAPAAPPVQAVSPAAAPWYAGITVWHLLGLAWLAGTVLLAVHAVIGYCRLARRVSLACKMADGCYTCAAVAAPFTLGILRPRVYMPADLTGPARAAVLRHERTHIARGDTVTKPLFYAAACLHWWNPLVWLAFAQFERTMECACDESAMRGQPPERRSDYGESILHYATLPREPVPGSLCFSRGRVRERVARVLRYRRPGRAVLAFCAAFTLLAGAACLVRPALAEAVLPAAAEEPAEPETPEGPPVAPAENDTEPEPAESDLIALSPQRKRAEWHAADERTPQEMAGYFQDPLPDHYMLSRHAAAGHQGDDLLAGQGSHVKAAAAGVVVESGYDSFYGNYILLAHPDAPGGDWTSFYAHMETPALVESGPVEAGQTLGYVGDTGYSFGMHLHFALCKGGLPLPPHFFTEYGGACAVAPAGESYESLSAPLTAEPASTYADSGPTADPAAIQDYLAENVTQAGTVTAAADGVVLCYGFAEGQERFVQLSHGTDAQGRRWVTEYTGLDSIELPEGSRFIDAGTPIGTAGGAWQFQVLVDGKVISLETFSDF